MTDGVRVCQWTSILVGSDALYDEMSEGELVIVGRGKHFTALWQVDQRYKNTS